MDAVESNNGFLEKISQKWTSLNLTIRAIVPLTFIAGLSLFIGGFSTISEPPTFKTSLNQAAPMLSRMEKDYILEHSTTIVSTFINLESPISESFITKYLEAIVIPKVMFSSLARNNVQYSKQIASIFEIPLFPSANFFSLLEKYAEIVKSKDNSFKEKVGGVSTNKDENVEFLFYWDDVRNDGYLLRKNQVNINTSWTVSEILDELGQQEPISEANYPTLHDLSSYSIRKTTIQKYYPRELLRNFDDNVGRRVLDAGIYNIYKKTLIKKEELYDDFVISLTLGVVGLVIAGTVSWYLFYAYRKIKKGEIGDSTF